MLMSKDEFGLVLFCSAMIALFLIPGALDALFALILVGMVPFTSFVIPPLAMLIVYVLLILLGIRWFATLPNRIADTAAHEKRAREKAREVVAKKTKDVVPSTTKRHRYRRIIKQAS